ncbi:MAG: hypothetical protein A4E65_00011 [Syntrophorhabdus sp. PtaU1.Bin153]|nr:MAG: hypothetical protein A4E65_00011 [Syntrophorhabdus sp. PtaU1.Bin153]
MPYVNLVKGNFQEVREGFCPDVRTGIRHPELKATAVVVRDDGIGLHHGVGLPGGLEGVLPDQKGLTERPVNISHVYMNMNIDISCILIVDENGPRGHCGIRVENRGKGLVVHLDEIEGLECRLLVHGRNGRNILTNVPHLVGRQHSMILGVAEHTPLDAVPVKAAYNSLNSGNLRGPTAVDLQDSRMGVGAPQYLGNQHSRQLDIRGVACLSGDLGQAVGSWYALPDNVMIIHGTPFLKRS